ncbi:MAG: DUF4129 domain-containing protein [Bacteroidota bacterium]
MQADSVAVRLPGPEELALLDDARFDYGTRPVVEAPSLFDQLLAWLANAVGDAVPPVVVQVLAEYGPWVLLVLGVAGLIWILTRSELRGVFSRKDRSREETPVFSVLEEDLRAGNFDIRMAEAVRDGRHRDVVRLAYLAALSDLEAAGAIRYQRQKTNHDYLRELSGHPAEPSFAELTALFASAWYGGRHVRPEAAERALEIWRVLSPEGVET